MYRANIDTYFKLSRGKSCRLPCHMMYLDSLILAKHSRQAVKTENPLINLIKLGRYVHYIAGQPSIYGAEF